MDEPNSNRAADDCTDGDDPPVHPVHPFRSHEQKKTKDTRQSEDEGEEAAKNKSESRWKMFKHRAHEGWSKTTWDRRVELAIATLIVVFAGLQLRVTIENNSSTSKQVGNLITAANQIQSAAGQFAKSAKGINGGVGDAVGKLNEQAEQLKGNVGQTKRLADETREANANVTAADRPWIGGNIQILNFEVNKQSTIAVSFTNSGKRPARIDFSQFIANWYVTFPFDTDAEFRKWADAVPSTTILVPGQGTQLMATQKVPLKQTDLDLAEGVHPFQTFFIFAKAEYTDLQSGETHFTHLCERFIPRMKIEGDTGFKNCTEYNDAK